MAKVYKRPDGNFVAIKADGTEVPVLPRALESGKFTGFDPIRDEQGVSAAERFTVKNLTSDPDTAKEYLDKIGYEVRQYGDGFNFAIRPKSSAGKGPWKVVDPDGFDAQDILDLTSDALSFGAQIAAGVASAPSGPLGEAAAVGGASAGVEALRQAAGSAMGVPNNIDPKSIATAGAAGAISVPVARGVGKLASVAARLGKPAAEAVARFSGIAGTDALPAGDALREAASWSRTNPKSLMRSTASAAEMVRQSLLTINETPFSENALAKTLTSQADEAGARYNMRDIVEKISSNIQREVKIPGKAAKMTAGTVAKDVMHSLEPSLNDALDRTLTTIHTILGDELLEAVPLTKAVEVKNYLQELLRRKGLFGDATKSAKSFKGIIEDLSATLRTDIETHMTQAGLPEYVPTMRAFEKKAKALATWRRAMRINDPTEPAQNARQALIRSLYSDSGVNWLTALKDLESTFGMEGVVQAAREARIGKVTGLSSEKGPSLLGGGSASRTVGLGALAFGHPIPAAMELAATSPKAALVGTKLLQGAAEMASRVGPKATRGGAVAVATAAARAIGKGVARDDVAPRAKKPTRIGI